MIRIKATYIRNKINKSIYKNVYLSDNEYIAIINHNCCDYIDHIETRHTLNDFYDIIDDFTKINVVIYLNVDYLPEGLFKYCVGLYKLDLSEVNYDIIPKYFCNQCRFLREIVFQKKLTKIDEYSLTACDFRTLDLSKFKNIVIEKSAATNCRHLHQLYLPNEYTVKLYSFAEAYTLKQINDMSAKDFVKDDPEEAFFFLGKLLDEKQNVQNLYTYRFNGDECPSTYLLKFIISQSNSILYAGTHRHYTLCNENDILIFGGGRFTIDTETNNLHLFYLSEGFGEPDFDKVNWKTLTEFNEVYYDDKLIYKKKEKFKLLLSYFILCASFINFKFIIRFDYFG